MQKSLLGIAILIFGISSGTCHADPVLGEDRQDPVGLDARDAAKKDTQQRRERREEMPQDDLTQHDDAQDHLDLRVSKDDFTGDRYAPSDFVDTDFRRAGPLEEMRDAFERRRRLLDAEFMQLDGHRDDKYFAEIEHLHPVENTLLDWVPDKPQRLQNGGFTTAEDNGKPVPYTLNGWITIERPYPWDKGN